MSTLPNTSTAPNLTGQTMVVTGATAGIGLATATELARRGAFVIGVGRSPARCDEAQAAIRTACPGARTTYCIADLSSLKQVRELAAEIQKRATEAGSGAVDALINNAGAFSSWYATSAEGFELQLAVNHLAPFLLTHELLGALKAAPTGRVVTVSSSSHYWTWINWNDIQLRKHYNCLWSYKRSKLANVLFTRELNRRLGNDSAVRAFAADPGLVNTEMGSKASVGIARFVWSRRRQGGVSTAEGAATSVFLASEPSIQDSPDIYWKDCRPKSPSRFSRRDDYARRLWEMSERMCNITSADYGL